MTLLFVGGVMNLIWVAALTILVAAEKLLPARAAIPRISGAVLIVWGLLRALQL
jgi:predicted metal-binding membrane protein